MNDMLYMKKDITLENAVQNPASRMFQVPDTYANSNMRHKTG
jgi:hypothetical protein